MPEPGQRVRFAAVGTFDTVHPNDPTQAVVRLETGYTAVVPLDLIIEVDPADSLDV